MGRPTMQGTGIGSTSEGIGEVLAFMQQLWALDHRLQELSRSMRSQHGITGPQRLVLRVAGIYPGISAGLVADILRVHRSTLTGVLKRLVEKDLIRREPDERDGRRVVLHLTAKGRRLASLQKGTVEGAVGAAMSRVPKRNLETTKEVLAVLTLALRGAG